MRPLSVWSLSLGCPKNRVDSEKLLGSLGLPIKAASHIGKSRLVFINTCGFIEPACRESIRAILDAAAAISGLKRKPLLAVAGCLPGRYGVEELAGELPEVDLWLPAASRESWPERLRAALGLQGSLKRGRLLSTGLSYAWLKIGEGCRHKCSFCAIPAIRGPLRSEPAADILAEARALLEQGVKELCLVAQDVSSWGLDFRAGLPGLLEKLACLPGLVWLRPLYLYPNGISDGLLSLMAGAGPPLLPYFDMPLQHVDPAILASMGRPFQTDARKLVERIRQRLPGAALRTTLITGYPGESEKSFRQLCDFVREARFHHLGVFPYWPEEGTRAASLPGQLPRKVREERAAAVMAIQAGISRDILAGEVGRRQPVLVDKSLEEEWPGLHAGRVWFQAPEVDGITYVSGAGVAPGAMPEAEIVESHDYDLVALA